MIVRRRVEMALLRKARTPWTARATCVCFNDESAPAGLDFVCAKMEPPGLAGWPGADGGQKLERSPIGLDW